LCINMSTSTNSVTSSSRFTNLRVWILLLFHGDVGILVVQTGPVMRLIRPVLLLLMPGTILTLRLLSLLLLMANLTSIQIRRRRLVHLFWVSCPCKVRRSTWVRMHVVHRLLLMCLVAVCTWTHRLPVQMVTGTWSKLVLVVRVPTWYGQPIGLRVLHHLCLLHQSLVQSRYLYGSPIADHDAEAEGLDGEEKEDQG